MRSEVRGQSACCVVFRDTFNKELESLQKKAKIIDAALKSAEQELEAFQVSCGAIAPRLPCVL